MKLLFFLSLMFIFQQHLFAQIKTLEFDQNDIPDLLIKAKTTDKLVFIDVTATWCKPCKEMETTTFKDSTVSAFYNKNFISKKFDLDAQYQDTISNRIKSGTSEVPRFYFLDNEGNAILVDGGLKYSIDFIEMGQKAIASKSLTSKLSALDLVYAQRKNSKYFLINYMSLRKQAGKKNGTVLSDYLELIPKEDYLKDSILFVIIKNETELDGKGFQIISSYENQRDANIRNNNPDLQTEMYATSIDIIRENAFLAIKKKDRKLLDKSFAEHIRVMQNKEEAKMINDQILEKFNQENTTH